MPDSSFSAALQGLLSLRECLSQLSSGALGVRPSEALRWLMGNHPSLSVVEAIQLVEQVGIANYPAYIGRDRVLVPLGIYAIDAGGQSWVLFYVIWQ